MLKEEYKNIIAFHPGYYLTDIIEELEMTQDEFAKRLGTTGKTVSLLLKQPAKLCNGQQDGRPACGYCGALEP